LDSVPILTLSKWVQRWKERLNKSNLSVALKRIVKDSNGITTKEEQWKQYIETPSEHTRINTERIAGELKKKLMIKDMGQRHESKNSIEFTIPFPNYADFYEEDEIIEFSIVESMKNKIEDELAGNLNEILSLAVTRDNRNLVVKIRCESCSSLDRPCAPSSLQPVYADATRTPALLYNIWLLGT
jgi:hypothetical protein